MGPFLNTALQGKRILLTGGGTGLGKEIARVLPRMVPLSISVVAALAF